MRQDSKEGKRLRSKAWLGRYICVQNGPEGMSESHKGNLGMVRTRPREANLSVVRARSHEANLSGVRTRPQEVNLSVVRTRPCEANLGG